MVLTTEFSRMAESVLSTLEAVDADERVAKYAHMAKDIIEQFRILVYAVKKVVVLFGTP